MSDTISRQAAIDYCYALINAENPSDPSDEWNYSQERINQTEVILHHLEFMPSAQPERKKGKWVGANAYCDHLNEEAKANGKTERYLPSGMVIGVYCDQCWCRADKKSDFCPNCGSYNGGENHDKG